MSSCTKHGTVYGCAKCVEEELRIAQTKLRSEDCRATGDNPRNIFIVPPGMSGPKVREIGPKIGFALRRLLWRLVGAEALHDAAYDFLIATNKRCGAIGVAGVYGEYEDEVRAASDRLTSEMNWFDPRWTIYKTPYELPPGVEPYAWEKPKA